MTFSWQQKQFSSLCLISWFLSVLNDTTLNGLAKVLEMTIKSYRTPTNPANKLWPVVPRFSLTPQEAKCCVQLLEPRVLLVPHRQSSGGRLQTASVGLRGGGAEALKTGKGAICWDKGELLGSRWTHTALILCSWPWDIDSGREL